MKLFLKNKNNFFAKNYCEIQVRTILVCTLYSIKYGNTVSLQFSICVEAMVVELPGVQMIDHLDKVAVRLVKNVLAKVGFPLGYLGGVIYLSSYCSILIEIPLPAGEMIWA